ncbi:hypothetical protein ABIB62_000260 [Mucilaginibacter sp. UYP25]|uniref:hypothetical protein n=1 Tax=unclassified Mucilaginibacter TaxID=2617802 RepID=UPI003397A762
MRIIKAVFIAFIIITAVSCSSKTQPQPTLAGNWKITSAVGNDGRQWTGSFILTEDIPGYKGVFQWQSVDGKSSGTDTVTATYESVIKVLIMRSVAVTGNIESVNYSMNVSNGSTKMEGVWTGSSDGTVENPGRLSAVKQ